MKKWMRTMLLYAVLVLLVFVGVNSYLFKSSREKVQNLYRVEINRLQPVLQENVDSLIQMQPEHIEQIAGLQEKLLACKWITNISFLYPQATVDQTQQFYQTNNSNSMAFFWPVISENETVCIVRFDYTVDGSNAWKKTIVYVNLAMGVLVVLMLLLAVMIRKKILQPFTRISELPYELSKGHLNGEILENEDRIFGRFIWGLNLLRENLEQEKRHSLELEKEKKTLILTISHDIKTPLSAIKLYARALSENLYETKEKRNEVAVQIGTNADKIEAFVEEIVDSSKNDFLHIEVKNAEFYLAELIGKFDSTYQEKMKLIRTGFEIDRFQDCILSGDCDRCLEAMENIMENAIKYGDGKWIHIGFAQEEEMQLIKITNSGGELPEEEVVHIFESFYRGSNAGNQNGSGLGLYICREIMHKMQGEIYAQKEKDAMSVVLVIPKI